MTSSPTTTHDPDRGGHPRLVMAPREDRWPGDRQDVFPLHAELTTIGSSSGCDIRLDGLDALEAEVRHDAEDEFVLVPVGGATRLNGAVVDEAVLRTASRVQLGEWTLTFARDEHADHGRPYGGRVGGEVGYQRPQPPREEVQGDE